MRKKILVMFCLAFVLLSFISDVYGTEEKDLLLDDYAKSYGEVFEDGIYETGTENIFLTIAPEFSMTEMLKSLNRGELSLYPGEIMKGIWKLLLGEVYSGARLMAVVLVMSILSSYLTGLKSSFGQSGVSVAAFYVCYIVAAGTAAAAFYETASCAGDAVNNVSVFMKIIVPAVVTMLYTSGAIVSASTLQPVILLMVEIIVPVVQTVFIPSVMVVAALNIVNGISERFKTDRMVKLLNNIVRWGLTIMLTVFVSLTGLKSLVSGGADGLALKLSKFATSNLVPLVGGILAESVETVMGCSVVIKNSVGVLGIICIIIIAAMPVLKLGAMIIVFRITAAIAEPVSDPKIISCISRLADSIGVLFSIVVSATVMFIIVITIMINTGNDAVMLGG